MRYNTKSIPARVDIEEYEEAMRHRNPLFRTAQGQISHWSKVGRYALAHPELRGYEIEKLVIDDRLKKQEECLAV